MRGELEKESKVKRVPVFLASTLMFRQVFSHAYFFTTLIQQCFFHTLSWGKSERNKHIPQLSLIPHCIHIFLPIFILSSGINQVWREKSNFTFYSYEGGFKKCFSTPLFPYFLLGSGHCVSTQNIERTDVITMYCWVANIIQILWSLYFLTFFFDFSFPVPETSVSAVQGSSVELPCNLTAPIYGDKVRLVLWFKNDSNLPIYT